MILASYTLWFALQLLIPEEKRVNNTSLRNFTLIITGVLFIQLMYGAFMAGLKAAVAAPTWPSINGYMIPNSLFSNGLLRDENLAALSQNIHFMHRGIAYLLIGLIFAWFLRTRKQLLAMPGSALGSAAKWPIIIVIVQVLLGIFAVLCAPMIRPGKFGTFEIIAESHQMVAMFLLMSLIVNYYVLSGKEAR
jgi:cytochrome c oxidase assembly protein subunit 15